MEKQFKKISVTKEIHDQLKEDRNELDLKSISETIEYYRKKAKLK